jgi:hypothetical protein
MDALVETRKFIFLGILAAIAFITEFKKTTDIVRG